MAFPVFGSDEEPASKPIGAGTKMPRITLDAPESEKDREYLALKNQEAFSLSQVPAKLFVLELFSVHCAHCRKQASKLNEIYRLIQQDHELMRSIRMIGIAIAGNQ